MCCQASFAHWLTIIMQHRSQLSKPQATGLAMWSFGMVLARSCALTAVSQLLAAGMPRPEQTVRQRRRECYDDVPRTRGTKRQALGVETGLAPLLGGVVSWWQGPQLALAIDATTLGAPFVVLAVSVGYRGGAIPVAWVVLPACATHAWRREWLRLWRRRRPAIPRAGRGSSWPMAAGMRRGGFDASRAWAGLRCCASTRVAAVGQQERPTGGRCGPWRRGRVPVGAARAWPVRAIRSSAPGWSAGKKATRTRG